MRIYLLIICVWCFSGALAAQEVVEYDHFDDFERAILGQPKSDTVYVVNFWATWCGPCVKELPFFNDLDQRVKTRPIKVVLVSLDFRQHLEEKFYPWLDAHPQRQTVVLLLDARSSQWIDRVDTSWSGAIPYTYVYQGKRSSTYEGSFATSHDLDDYITAFIKSL